MCVRLCGGQVWVLGHKEERFRVALLSRSLPVRSLFLKGSLGMLLEMDLWGCSFKWISGVARLSGSLPVGLFFLNVKGCIDLKFYILSLLDYKDICSDQQSTF